MAELMPFKTYTGVQKQSALAQKIGVVKEVGITIKISQLSSYKITGYPLYKLHWLLFVSVHTNLQDLIPTLALVVCDVYSLKILNTDSIFKNKKL